MPGGRTHPALPGALNRRYHALGFLVVTEAHEDLVEDHVVDHRRPLDGGKVIGEPTGERTASLHQLSHAVAAQLPQRRPRGEPTSPPGGLEHYQHAAARRDAQIAAGLEELIAAARQRPVANVVNLARDKRAINAICENQSQTPP